MCGLSRAGRDTHVMSWPLRAIDCIFIIVGTEFLPVMLAAGGNFVVAWIPSAGRCAYDIVFRAVCVYTSTSLQIELQAFRRVPDLETSAGINPYCTENNAICFYFSPANTNLTTFYLLNLIPCTTD